jgi:hypothetical protein
MAPRQDHATRRGAVYELYRLEEKLRANWCFRKGHVFSNLAKLREYNKMAVPLSKLLLDLDGLDKLIEWKVYQYLGHKEAIERGEPVMQVQVTIELRCDFEDKDKVAVLIEAAQTSARHMLATASLLSDKTKPQIVVFTDDFFSGHKDIPLFADKIAQGEKLLESGQDTAVSDEMLAAMKA